MLKRTLITGATSGLGFEFARIYLREGNDLVLIGSKEERLALAKEKLLKEFPEGQIDTFVADLSEESECERVYLYVKEQGYFINNLVNSAGLGDRTDFKDSDLSLNMKLTRVNCCAVLYFTRVFLDAMLEHDEGHIINVSSMAAFMPGPFMATYHASKAYVLYLGEAVARELKNTNVHVFTLCPGPFWSEFVTRAHNEYIFSQNKPMTAEEVALYGYRMSIKGKTMKICGFKNNFTCFITKLFPRKMVIDVSAMSIKKLKKGE